MGALLSITPLVALMLFLEQTRIVVRDGAMNILRRE
jgi:hypothetical protein